MTERIAYVVLDDGWDEQRSLATTYAILDLLGTDIAEGDFWIEWHIADRWPADIRAAAERLRDRFAPDNSEGADLCFQERINGSAPSICGRSKTITAYGTPGPSEVV